MEQQRQRTEPQSGHTASPGSQALWVWWEQMLPSEQQLMAPSTCILVDSRPSTASSAASLSLEEQPQSREADEWQPCPVEAPFFSSILLQAPPTCSVCIPGPRESQGSHELPHHARKEAGCVGGVSVNRCRVLSSSSGGSVCRGVHAVGGAGGGETSGLRGNQCQEARTRRGGDRPSVAPLAQLPCQAPLLPWLSGSEHPQPLTTKPQDCHSLL
ncbi:hypothetical protein AAY473_000518 [Plecturocebus cupreus]